MKAHLAADGEDDLADVYAGSSAVRLAPRAAHAGLEPALWSSSAARSSGVHAGHAPISPSARQHLVDAQHMERVHAHAQVE